jgi:hypothetical protein
LNEAIKENDKLFKMLCFAVVFMLLLLIGAVRNENNLKAKLPMTSEYPAEEETLREELLNGPAAR